MFKKNFTKIVNIKNEDVSKIKVSLNDTQYINKPSGKEQSKMTNKFISEELTLLDIGEKIQLGETFCRVKLRNSHRCNENFESFQLIWCDIDDEYDINSFLRTCDKYTLIPSVIYPTFSDRGEFKRFRAIFKLDKAEKDIRTWYLLTYMMNFIFDFKDSSNESLSQSYLGTNKEVYLYNHYEKYSVTTETIFLATLQKLNESDPKLSRRKLQQFHERTGVKANSKTIKIKEELTEDIIFDYLIDQEEFKKLKLKFKTKVDESKIIKGNRYDYKIRKINIDTLANRCNLIKKFINLEYLNHYERTYLGNMFYYIENIKSHEGQVFRAYNWYFGVLKQLVPLYKTKSAELNDPMKKSYDDVVNGIEGVNRSGVIWNCERSCSLYSDCKNNCKNLLSLCRVDAPVKTKYKIETENLNNTNERFRSDYINVINSIDGFLNKETEVTLFSIETGIGKTEAIVNAKYTVPTIIAVPTHDLKDELYRRMKEAKVNDMNQVLVIPERPAVEDENINSIIKNYENLGLYTLAHSMYKTYAEDQFKLGNKKYIEYIDTMQSIENVPHLVAITTHARVIVSQIAQNYKNIVFDEDPTDKIIISNKAIFDDVTTLQVIAKQNNWSEFIVDGFKMFKNIINTSIDNNKYFIKNEVDFNYKSSFKDIPVSELPKTNIWGAMNRNTYIHIDPLAPGGTTLNYIYTRDISSFNNKNIIILSATPNVAKIKKLFSEENFYQYEYPKCRKKGIIIQDLTYSFSKNALDNNFDKLVKYIDSNHEDKDKLILITYMKLKHKFEKAGFKVDEIIHFGNCEGYDHLKGEDLIIVGRMYAPKEHYELMAWYMGDISLDEIYHIEFINRRATINGFEVTLNCFNDDRVNEYLFYDIEKNLEQAIGRSRALREDCKVYIYTNYPIPLANEYKFSGEII